LPEYSSRRFESTQQGESHLNPPDPVKFADRNESLLSNLLLSAYLVQRKQDMIRSSVSSSRFNEILATLINTRFLLSQSVHFETAMQLILSRTQKVSGASGAAVCVAENGTAEYLAGTGVGIRLAGLRFPESECPFFSRAREHPEVEWGDLEEPEAKQRIVVGFELRTPICCRGRVVGCLKLFSRIRQFGSETIHICELMSVFLEQLLRNQSPSTPNEPVRFWPSQMATKVAAVSQEAKGRVVSKDRGQLPTQDCSSEAKGIELLVARDFKSAASSAPDYNLHQRRFGSYGGKEFDSFREKEEEQLPTMDELLRQLGAAFEEGSLSELGTVTTPAMHAGSTPLARPTVTPLSTHVVKIALATQAGEARGGIEQPTPDRDKATTHEQGSGRRHGFGNAASFIFPIFVFFLGVTLNISRASLSVGFRGLTLSVVAFSLLEIWRAAHGDR
jgi:hypothetical protein